MPVYEYICRECSAKFSELVGMTGDSQQCKCQQCGSVRIEKLVSRVGKFRGESGRLDDLTDRIEQMGEPSSHESMRKTLRDAGAAMDEGMSDEMEELFEADLEGGDGSQAD